MIFWKNFWAWLRIWAPDLDFMWFSTFFHSLPYKRRAVKTRYVSKDFGMLKDKDTREWTAPRVLLHNEVMSISPTFVIHIDNMESRFITNFNFWIEEPNSKFKGTYHQWRVVFQPGSTDPTSFSHLGQLQPGCHSCLLETQQWLPEGLTDQIT